MGRGAGGPTTVGDTSQLPASWAGRSPEVSSMKNPQDGKPSTEEAILGGEEGDACLDSLSGSLQNCAQASGCGQQEMGRE